MTGDHMTHPLLISLANILANFWLKSSHEAFVLLALLPVPKFIHQNTFTKTHSQREHRAYLVITLLMSASNSF